MPAERNKQGKLASSTDPEYEKHMQEAMEPEGQVSREFKSIRNQGQKKAEDEAQLTKIGKDIETKVFNGPISSYTRKYDLIVLCGTLGLSQDGTRDELKARMKAAAPG